MAAVITDVQPRRFRSGDDITVTGSGFSPVFGDNRVNVNLGTPATIVSESDTVIVIEVPAGIPTNQQIEVIVSRVDTQAASLPFVCWSLETAAAFRDYDVPGQAPGPREAEHLDVDVQDVGQARDYERTATHALRIANEILQQQGDIFTSDGSLPVRLPIGGGDMELHTRTAEALDLRWEEASRWLTHRWGLEFGLGALLLVANGDAFAGVGTDNSEHGMPFDGTLTRLGLLVHFAFGGDTLDQVRVLVNAVQVYTSGGGLGLSAGQFHIAALSVAVNFEDRITVEGTVIGGGTGVNVTAAIRIKETTSVKVADTVQVSDLVTIQKIGNQARSAQDAVAVSDLVSVEQIF